MKKFIGILMAVLVCAEVLFMGIMKVNAEETQENKTVKVACFLYYSYLEKGQKHIPVFTDDEKEYIEKAGEIRVALYPDRNILSSYDEKTESFSGITYDVMEMISEKTGLKFEYSEMPSGVRGYEYFEQDKADIIAPVTVNEFIKLSDKVQELELGISTSLVMVGRKDFKFDTDAEFDIVLNKSFFGTDASIQKLYPNANITFADSQDKCFKMVASEEADVTFDNRLVALYRLRSPYYEDVLTTYEGCDVEEHVSIIFPVNKDEILISIISKTLDSITDAEINSIIINNTASRAYDHTFAELVYEYRYYVIAGVLITGIIIYLVIFLLVLRKRDKKYKEEKRHLEEKRAADEKYQKQLYYQANFDEMTGLYNRNGFYQKTREMLDENPHVKFMILRGDIDQFKVFNDIMGVTSGNNLIKYVADMWRAYFDGQFGTYGHFGGDDYICCCEYHSFDEVEMMDTINEWFEKYEESYSFSISLGAYIIDDNSMDISIMCDRAELALEKAKKNNRSHFCIYENAMREQVIKEQEIVNYIPTAFEKEQFEIYLQPQYDSVTKKIVGAEALTRWKHPEQGMISPGVFIPVMEANGMITKLDMYVVEHVCRILKRLYEQENISKDFSIAVNLSRVDAFNCDIVEKISELLDKYKIPTTGLRLEITESAYIDQNEKISDFVKGLKEKGFMIEMDDFGSGYSSLNALKDVPIDTLKLDLRFLSGDNSKKGGIIINSVVRMAKWMDIPVIAEGVENIKQVDYLKNIGCHYMQGFYFAKPMPVNEFIKLLEANSIESIDRNGHRKELAYTEEVLDTKNINSKILNKIGPAAVAEYSQGKLESVILNDSFYEMAEISRDKYKPYEFDMLLYLDEHLKEEFKNKIETLGDEESIVFTYSINISKGIAWRKCRMSTLSSIEGRKTIIMVFQDITEEKTNKY